MQGMSGENIKFLLDGVPIIGRMNGGIDLNQLNLNNVDHIEIIEGPMSVIYGSNALAGVINIITKENKVARIATNIDTYWENVGVYNFDAGLSLNKRKHVFALNGGRHFFDGFSLEDTSRSQTWKPKRQYFFDTYYIYSLPKTKLKLAGQYFNEKIQDKGGLQPPYYETAFDTYFYTFRYSARLEGSHQFNKTHFMNFIGSWSGYDRVKNTYFKDLTTLEEVLTVTRRTRTPRKLPHGWCALLLRKAMKTRNSITRLGSTSTLKKVPGSGSWIMSRKSAIMPLMPVLSMSQSR
jgi:outer membrane receptor for ferrienterochelin and colicins